MQVSSADNHSKSGFKLHLAAKSEDLGYVRFLVERKNYNPVQRDQVGFAPFHMAAIVGNVQVLKYFINECNCKSKLYILTADC